MLSKALGALAATLELAYGKLECNLEMLKIISQFSGIAKKKIERKKIAARLSSDSN